MRGIILLNGEPYNSTVPKNTGGITVCCDGAYNWAKNKTRIDVFLGDFDSLGYVPENALVYEKEKDYTDGELAVRYLIEKGCRQIDIYGGGGGREDHFLGNLALLYLALKSGVSAVMHNNNATIFITGSSVKLKGRQGSVLSAVPFAGDAHINKSKGLKYPLDNLKIGPHSTRGISNILTAEDVFVDVKQGTVLLILNKE